MGDTEHRVWSDEGQEGQGWGLGPVVSGPRAGWAQIGALWMGELRSSVVAGVGGAEGWLCDGPGHW